MPDEEEEDWDKIVGQFRLALGVVMNPLSLYGQSHYVTTAMEEIVSLALQLHHKLYGIDEPFIINQEKLHW